MSSDLAGDGKGKGEVLSGAHAKRELARKIAAHLFSDVIRVHGRGRYHRTPEGVWLGSVFHQRLRGSRYLYTSRRRNSSFTETKRASHICGASTSTGGRRLAGKTKNSSLTARFSCSDCFGSSSTGTTPFCWKSLNCRFTPSRAPPSCDDDPHRPQERASDARPHHVVDGPAPISIRFFGSPVVSGDLIGFGLAARGL